jgi:hypothetical protein
MTTIQLNFIYFNLKEEEKKLRIFTDDDQVLYKQLIHNQLEQELQQNYKVP